MTIPEPNPLCHYELTNEFTLKGELARTLLQHSAARQREPVEVLADLIEIILRDNLVDAILDDG